MINLNSKGSIRFIMIKFAHDIDSELNCVKSSLQNALSVGNYKLTICRVLKCRGPSCRQSTLKVYLVKKTISESNDQSFKRRSSPFWEKAMTAS